jgi:hemolysin activation/secretion protein
LSIGRGVRDATRFACFCFFALALLAPPALAQTPPDAGRIQEQLRVPELPRRPAAPQIRIEPPPGEAKADSPPFFVSGFRVAGASVFPERELVALLGDAGRPMTLGEIQTRADRVTARYKDAGYIVARALVPAQDVREGVVEIRVIEGRYERIDIANASEVSETRLRALLGEVREDSVVHGPTLERAVLLISDLAGVQPKATLEPGAQAGFTNLVMEVTPTKKLDLDVSVDNGGSRFTGRYRATYGAAVNSPLGIGDRLAVRYTTSGQLLDSLRLGYDTPLGSRGLRGSIYMSETSYELGEEFAALDASGSARNFGAGLAYPWLRSAERNVRVHLGGEYRELDDRLGPVHNEKTLGLVQWGVGGDMRDAFFGGGLTIAQATVTHGKVTIHTPALITQDAATARTHGRYNKLFLALNRLQTVTENLRGVLSYTGQRATGNLDSSEKFSVGGMTGVRAYPPGEAAGDDVHLFQAELRYNAGSALGAQLTPSLFWDHARSRLNHDTWQGFTGTNERTLTGVGAGLEWTAPGQFFIRTWLARKVGNEPATADTDRRHRLWLQAGVLF